MTMMTTFKQMRNNLKQAQMEYENARNVALLEVAKDLTQTKEELTAAQISSRYGFDDPQWTGSLLSTFPCSEYCRHKREKIITRNYAAIDENGNVNLNDTITVRCRKNVYSFTK